MAFYQLFSIRRVLMGKGHQVKATGPNGFSLKSCQESDGCWFEASVVKG